MAHATQRKRLGSVESIIVRPAVGVAATSLPSVQCDAGIGPMGDHESEAARAAGNFARKRQITLISHEALADVEAELGITFTHVMSRRNVLTKGVDLNSLVGREFEIGGVRMVGTALCHPCQGLEDSTAPGVMAALNNKGGLCAQVLSSGELSIGMAVEA